MPKFRVTALEKFVVETVYELTAVSKEQAEILCRTGHIAYESHEVQEGDEEWIETVDVEEI